MSAVNPLRGSSNCRTRVLSTRPAGLRPPRTRTHSVSRLRPRKMSAWCDSSPEPDSPGQRGWSARPGQHAQQLPDLMGLLKWVPERKAGVQHVAVAAALPGSSHVPGFYQVGHQALGRTLGDANLGSYVPASRAGIAGDAQQHMPVVGQERPCRFTGRHVVRILIHERPSGYGPVGRVAARPGHGGGRRGCQVGRWHGSFHSCHGPHPKWARSSGTPTWDFPTGRRFTGWLLSQARRHGPGSSGASAIAARLGWGVTGTALAASVQPATDISGSGLCCFTFMCADGVSPSAQPLAGPTRRRALNGAGCRWSDVQYLAIPSRRGTNDCGPWPRWLTRSAGGHPWWQGGQRAN